MALESGFSRREQVALASLAFTLATALAANAWLRRPKPFAIDPAPEEAARWDAALALAGTLNVNTSRAEEWEYLPGIGPALARRIVETRERLGRFSRPEDLLEVPGIGAKKLDSLRPYLRME